MRICFDPANTDHFFISTWGDGLLEYNNSVLLKHWDDSNSPLEQTASGIRILGLDMDRARNLWVTQSGTVHGIKIRKVDGTWAVHNAITDAPVAGDIISTRSGQKWIILPGGYGVLVIDDNNTSDIFTDDRSKRINVTDADGTDCNAVFSIAEDLDGSIWLGTDKGPVIYSNPGRIFENDIRGYRIKVPRNDGSGLADYMLGTETITSVAVDGANRKWLGTSGSGAFLLSPDGTGMLENFNEKTSPIFSDSIITVSVDNTSGEVWFGTSKGIISLRGTATSGRTGFAGVYSFPNPVRQDYLGNVTITGLMRDTRVKITDVSGNLVFETVSEGGQASWDLTTYNGRRVATGIYLVLCAAADGTSSVATKILVIGR
jgi:ligand-binding sensor domain-containing protein